MISPPSPATGRTQTFDERRKALGANVLRLIEARRMSFADASKATGLSKTGLYKIADGTSDPALSSLYKIADAFGVTVPSLLAEVPRG